MVISRLGNVVKTALIPKQKQALGRVPSGSFESIMEMSAALQAVAHLTEEHMEGFNALLEKRSPDFQGR